MISATSTFKASDGVAIFRVKWSPPADATVRAVVHIAHGMGEHCLRYRGLAEQLTAAGYMVYAHDHRGHGRTIPEGLGHVTPVDATDDGFLRIAEDLHELITAEKADHPGLKMLLLGHSMGSIVSQIYAGQHGDQLDALMLSGRPARPNLVLATALPLMLSALKAKNGPKGISSLVKQLTFDEYNKKFAPNRTDFDWLSTDEQQVDLYIKDPLCGFDMTVGFMADLLKNLISLKESATHAALPANLPVHVIAGDSDPCTEGKSPEQIRAELKAAGKKAPKITLYPDCRHEILNEVRRVEVGTDVVNWFNLVTMPSML